jgi:hypothetical protein
MTFRGGVGAACVFLFAVTIPLLSAKPYPAGIYSLFVANTGEKEPPNMSNKAAWTNPHIDGVRLRTSWQVLEPQKGTYDWSYIDQALSLGNQNQKQVGFSVAAGVYSPTWVYTNGATKYTLADGSGNSMPLPWDTAFQNQWLPFIRALGARYDGNPALAYVCPTGFMQVCVMYLAKTTADDTAMNQLAVQAGYSSSEDAFVQAAKKILTTFMESFPTTPVILNPVPPLLTNGMEAQSAVKNFGLDTYPGHFGVMYPSLRATRAPHKPSPGPLSYPKGFQMICVATDVQELYGNPSPPYNPPVPTPLLDALANANSLQGQFVEVYGADLTNDSNVPALTSERPLLKKNLPVQAPKNLQIY